MSSSVSAALTHTEKIEFTEPARFCHFDCLNTWRFGEGKEAKKPDLEPYLTDKDERFNVSFNGSRYLIQSCVIIENTFLGYLKEWKESVNGRDGFDKTARTKMMLN